MDAQHISHMQRTLGLARQGIGLASPNPIVGCVILDSHGNLAGEGWHEYERRDHAEIVALKAAGERARGGTAYVTLEPCNHTGRTGPCSEALIAAGVARVVAATVDPNPLVAGQGLERLRAAGVQVETGICEPEAQKLNEGFARWIVSKHPLVHMKVAMTLDGRIAPPPARQHPRREPYWITGEAARGAVQSLRHSTDAIITGVDTVIADNPRMTDRSGLPRRRPLLRVVLDSALRLPLDSHLATTEANDIVVFTLATDETRTRALEAGGLRVIQLAHPAGSDGRLPLGEVLKKLGGEGILTLLTETGTRLNTALLAGGYVDRVTIFTSPQIMGSDAVPAFRALGLPVHLQHTEIERYGDDFSMSALLRNPWSAVG